MRGFEAKVLVVELRGRLFLHDFTFLQFSVPRQLFQDGTNGRNIVVIEVAHLPLMPPPQDKEAQHGVHILIDNIKDLIVGTLRPCCLSINSITSFETCRSFSSAAGEENKYIQREREYVSDKKATQSQNKYDRDTLTRHSHSIYGTPSRIQHTHTHIKINKLKDMNLPPQQIVSRWRSKRIERRRKGTRRGKRDKRQAQNVGV